MNRQFTYAVLCAVSLGCTTTTPGQQGPVSVEGSVASVPTADALIRVSAPARGVMRIQFSPSGEPAPQVTSFVVEPETLAHGAPVTVVENEGVVTVTGDGAAVRITRSPLHVALLDAEGTVISEETSSVEFEGAPSLRGPLHPDAHVYGLGDKVKSFDRRGKSYTLWNKGTWGWDARKTDPLNKSVPFVLVLEGERAHGIFIDNPSKALVDVGASNKKQFVYEASHAPVWDVYLFAGPDPKSVLEAWTALTGRMPLPPRWALGFQQSRWSYPTEGDVREVAAQLRANQVPADVVWLDIEYHQDYAPFTVNETAFPNFGPLISDLLAMHLRTVIITDMGIKKAPGAEPYESGTTQDVFLRKPNGSVFVGQAWPGDSVFPDFSLSRVRTWWGGLYAPYVEQGVAGFWNDMNEPDLLGGDSMPDDVRHRLDDGTSVDHLTAHNAYGHLNARATWEGVKALRPTARPFVLTRASFAGTQRWAATWTGDNRANREHLAVTIPQLVNLGVSGQPFVGADVGGFVGCPDRELLVEWHELGAYQPFFRNHATWGSCRREPWASGPAVLARIRTAIEARYRLLPYLYTAFEETARTGLPVMRPLWLEYASDPSTFANDRAFMLGRDLLVAPKLAAGAGPWDVVLPVADWWDVSAGLLVRDGGSITVTPMAGESVRVFARAGSIIPQQPVAQWADGQPAGELTLDVWPGEACEGSLYLDAGDGYGYQAGELRRVGFACDATESGITVRSTTASGAFPTWWSSTRVVIHGVPRAPSGVTSGVAGMQWQYAEDSQVVVATLPGGLADWSVSAAW